MSFHRRRILGAALVAASLTGLATAAGGQEDEESGYDRIWKKTELYAGGDDSFVRSVRLTGRLQLDLAYVDSGDGDHGEFNVRRFRFGFKTVFLKATSRFTSKRISIPQEADPFYTKLTDAYLAWSPNKAVQLTAGKAQRRIHPRRHDVVEEAPDHRPQQPDQQHLVHRRVHPRRQRQGQDRAADLPRRRLLPVEDEDSFPQEIGQDCRPLGALRRAHRAIITDWREESAPRRRLDQRGGTRRRSSGNQFTTTRASWMFGASSAPLGNMTKRPSGPTS